MKYTKTNSIAHLTRWQTFTVSHLLDLLLCTAALCPFSRAVGNPSNKSLVVSWFREENCWRILLKTHRCNMTMLDVFCQPPQIEVNPSQSKLTSHPPLCPPWLSNMFNSSGARGVSAVSLVIYEKTKKNPKLFTPKVTVNLICEPFWFICWISVNIS